MAEKLAQELIDCVNNQGNAIKKKEETHKENIEDKTSYRGAKKKSCHFYGIC